MIVPDEQAKTIGAPPFTSVPDGIRVVGSRLRSVNLERDAEATDVGHVYLGSRALDALSRLAAALDDPARTRAWSLTGPYGTGKSTIANFIVALLGPTSNRRSQAQRLLGSVNHDLARRIAASRDRMASDGFITAIATARREPLMDTLVRALYRGANVSWQGDPPRRVKSMLKAMSAPAAGNAEVLAALQALCAEGPVLLVIDEFGKTLEYLAGRREIDNARDDVFALQEIAELGAGKAGLPLFALTLQHLSFLDYSAHSTSLQRREWAKVQGRFEDITFTPDLSDAIQLIKGSISHTDLDTADRTFIRHHGAASSDAWSRLGLQGVLPAEPSMFAALYPLHPLTAAAAPLIAGQIGQHDRSLTGFLSGDEPHTVQRFVVDRGTSDADGTTTVQLPQLYDYFFASGRTTMLASANASRWIEIELILSEAHGLDELDLRILKTIGILNLVDASGALRASPGVILFALTDPVNDDDDVGRKALLARLQNLVERGFVVYREFSDEYRIWQGTDIDLRARISEARERCDDHTVAKMLAAQLPAAVVAGRHSQHTGMLRHFVAAVYDRENTMLVGPAIEDPADGMLIFHVGDQEELPKVRSPLPAVVGTSKSAAAVLDAGRELMALNELISADDLDAVARREITERAGQARADLAAVVSAAFNPSKPGVRWRMLNITDTGGEAEDLKGRSLASIVSRACDLAYPGTPYVRNEMLGRHQLTSQGAKARRELITAMLTYGSHAHLGITGYGPERAIYDGVLDYLGLHKPGPDRIGADQPTGYRFAEPGTGATLYPAWSALRTMLTRATQERPISDLFRLLMAPPFGIKSGVVPVIITAALILAHDEVAVFEEGTYQPALSPDLLERLVKAPDRYSVKYVPASYGQRRLVLEAIATELKISYASESRPTERNSALLTVTKELLNQVRSLSTYASRTQRLSESALAVRRALVGARDPDDLLFTALPQALGLAAIPPDAACEQDFAADYASRLSAARHEITTADNHLRDEVVGILAREFRHPEDISIPSLRRTLAALTTAFADGVHDPELRGFITLARNDSLSDDEWLDPVAVRMVHAGLTSWTDAHLKQFEQAARKLARAFDRLAVLYATGDSAGHAGDGEVQLLAVMGHDGHEERVLVHMPSHLRDSATRLAAEVRAAADKQLGADGARILLAALARVLAAPDASEHGERNITADRPSA